MLCFSFETSYLFVVGCAFRSERLLCRLPQTSEPQNPDGSAAVPPDALFLPRVRSSAQAPPRDVPTGGVVGEVLLFECDVI